jgi:hypothetical protein
MTSNRSPLFGRPSPPTKPPALQGSPLSDPGRDYLNDNLLFDDDSGPPKFTATDIKVDTKRLLIDHINTSNRLVIAIDYGTTFTGK